MFHRPSTWKHDNNEQKQAIFRVLSDAELLSYEGWLCRGTQLPKAPELQKDYAQNYLYVHNNDTQVLYYITEEGNAEVISGPKFDFNAFEQKLEQLVPYSLEETDVWALSHEQFQHLITCSGGPAPKSPANPVMTAEIDFAPDDSVALNYFIRALIPFNELFGDLDIQLKQDLITRLITTSGVHYYPDALADLVIHFTQASPPAFSRLPLRIREEIAKTVLYAQRPLEVAEQMRSLYDMGFLKDGDADWPKLSDVLKQSPEPRHYVAALKNLCDQNVQLFSRFLEDTQLLPENSFDLLAFLTKISKDQRVTYLRLSQHILSPLIQDVSDEQLLEMFDQQLMQKFMQHVAYGQQDEAEVLLQSDHNLAQKLLIASKNPFTDYSGRTFTCTAYEYAYWALDTHMRRMLEQYMDDNTKAKLLIRVQKIEERVGPEFQNKPNGLPYTDNNGNEQRSAHFDFSELKSALEDFTNDYHQCGRRDKHSAWMMVGKAQRDVPAHVAHEYCRPDRSFSSSLLAFDEATLPRRLTFCSKYTLPSKTSFWFPLASDIGLGLTDAAQRSWFYTGAAVSDGTVGMECVSACKDLEAITLLESVRTTDLKKCLNNLKPPREYLSLQKDISLVKKGAKAQLVPHSQPEKELKKYMRQLSGILGRASSSNVNTDGSVPAEKVAKVSFITSSTSMLGSLALDLAKQEKEFNTLVRQLNDIAARLAKKHSSKVYADASRIALLLSQELQLAGETFFAAPDAESFKAFKASCQSIFASKEAQALKEHRDVWFQIHPVFRGILGVLAVFTIIPALIVTATSKHGYMGTFFTTPETTSGQELSKLALKQNESEAEIEAELAKFTR